jgi:hypothetical protein
VRGWVVCGTMDPSPSTDRKYTRHVDFNMVFTYKGGTYVSGTRYLRVGARYKVHGGELSGAGTYVEYLIHQCFTI